MKTRMDKAAAPAEIVCMNGYRPPRSTLLLVALSLAPLAACHKAEPSKEAPPLPEATVRVQVIEEKSHPVVEEVVGTVRARSRAAVEAKTSGRIARMLVDLGQKVKKDDLIAEIDAQEVKAQLERAVANRDQAARDLQRYTDLLKKQVTSRQDFDNAESRFRVADAAVKEAETMKGYLQVRAPFDGVVTRRIADTGDFATPGKPLIELENPDSLRFEADVPAMLIDAVRPGQDVTVTVSSLPKPVAGRVAEIAPTADPNSRTFLVRIDLPATAGLRTGQFGRAAIPVGESISLRVPADALVVRGQMEMVFIREDGRIRLRLVKSGKTIGDEVEILSGVSRGESVVSRDAGALVDGQPAKVQP